jgi:glycosyltransferase involved in cell wall biosynthesis
VTHAYCPSLATTPGGSFELNPDDSDTLDFAALDLGEPLSKYSYVRRRRQELQYGRMASDLTLRIRPDVVLSANMPLDAQARLLGTCRRLGVPFVFWLQDVIGVATHRLLRRRLPLVGEIVGRYYLWLEARLLRHSDAVVVITDDFRPLLQRWRVPAGNVHTIENWAPLSELPPAPKDNPWAREHDLVDRFVFLYAGTMGMKHNPELIARLAESVRDRPDACVVVLSQGPGADYLREQASARSLPNLLVRGYEPFERMSEVMGAADVLTAVLEPDAGAFSVPSKVLAYLCAGRPLLTAMPLENLASRIVSREEAGLVVAPDDVEGFVAAGRRLLDDAAVRENLGANARAYAERAFDIEAITNRFEEVLSEVAGGR